MTQSRHFWGLYAKLGKGGGAFGDGNFGDCPSHSWPLLLQDHVAFPHHARAGLLMVLQTTKKGGRGTG